MRRPLRLRPGRPHLDVADFVSDALAVKPADGGRRHGLNVTRDVKAGELLAFVKPFASCLWEEVEAEQDVACFDRHHNVTQERTAARMPSKLVIRCVLCSLVAVRRSVNG